MIQKNEKNNSNIVAGFLVMAGLPTRLQIT